MLDSDFTLIKLLGKGVFGEVYLTSKKGSSIKYATKKLDKEKYSKNAKAKKYLDNEIDILKAIDHPNIVKLIDIQETLQHCFIVTEFCNGGSLSNCLEKYQQKHKKAFPEEIVQYLMRQIMDAICYLHDKKILHRDLKSDNILINYDDENDRIKNNIIKGTVKIIDFGFARYLKKEELAYSALGSPINMDPGILKKLNKLSDYKDYGYDEKADIWSLGTICYELLVGKNAYDSKSMKELLIKIQQGNYSLPITLSKEAISFLNCMLQNDPKKRLVAKKLCHHKFLKNDVKTFKKINLKELKGKVKGKKLQINSILNQTISNIFGDDIIESITEETDSEDENDVEFKEKKSVAEIFNSLTDNVFENKNNKNIKKQKSERKKDTLEDMFWKAFDEINSNSISIQPKFAPFIPGIESNISNINII